MPLLIPFAEVTASSTEELGSKARLLAELYRAGLPVPAGCCLPAAAYHAFVRETGLADFITMELSRKDFAEMRWEEVWDVALRIRNHFVTRPWPATLKEQLSVELEQGPAAWPAVAVRSAAPGEDSGQHSFAGLHDSRVMLSGTPALLDAIRVVWASLWSDGALLYRQELGLDPARSGMAVIIQEMIVGERSGVLFSRAPHDPQRMAVEAVWGLNQALVDGTLAPDRWLLERGSGAVAERHRVAHTTALRPTERGPALVPLDAAAQGQSPLDTQLCGELFRFGQRLEKHLNAPVDVEWTVRGADLFLLQVRPITPARPTAAEDQRPWYLSLHRSLPSLERLQADLEETVLPGMARAAAELVATDPATLDDAALAAELGRRQAVLDHWLAVYREKCIPMAHGIRLFGEFYNETMQPDDPYAFLALLRSGDLLAVERNRQLRVMARVVRDNTDVWQQLATGVPAGECPALQPLLEDFRARFGDLHWISQGAFDLSDWLLKLAAAPERGEAAESSDRDAVAFLGSLPVAERALAARLLPVARASYRLRDNDNLYLGKVRAAVQQARQEARRRVQSRTSPVLSEALAVAEDADTLFAVRASAPPPQPVGVQTQARQLIGQPAGPGIAAGPVRVLQSGADLRAFHGDEVLVCDAIEPNMTFLVPLAAAIVERRGGMLIHGAIIAREYGIPCVTGIHAATERLRTGDRVTVDGYLGIVTVESPPSTEGQKSGEGSVPG